MKLRVRPGTPPVPSKGRRPLRLSAEVEGLGEATADLLTEAARDGMDPMVYRRLRNEFNALCGPVREFYRRLENALQAAEL